MAVLKDSGNRREFESGAVRDMEEGKGRMDLIPWKVCEELYFNMKQLYCRHRAGLVYDSKNELWVNGEMNDVYPELIYQMGVMDGLLNPAPYAEPIDSEMLYQKIAGQFIELATIFCLTRWGQSAPIESPDEENPNKSVNYYVNRSFSTAMLEVAKHYEDGAKKYDENNWRKGMEVKIYFDSASRHLMKYMASWNDEPHDRAFLWNCLCGAWECDAMRYKLKNCCSCSTLSDHSSTVSNLGECGEGHTEPAGKDHAEIDVCSIPNSKAYWDAFNEVVAKGTPPCEKERS